MSRKTQSPSGHLVDGTGGLESIPLLAGDPFDLRVAIAIIVQILLLLEDARVTRRRERKAGDDDRPAVSVAKVQSLGHLGNPTKKTNKSVYGLSCTGTVTIIHHR